MTEPATGDKRVTWAEAFFDLVFVLSVVQVSNLLGEHHQWWGLGRALVILLLVYRAWVSISMQTNRLGQDRTRDRISLFAVALCGIFLALSVPDAYGDSGLQFAISLWLVRFILWVRYFPRTRLVVLSPNGFNVFFTGPLVILGAFLPDTTREVVWAAAAVIDLGSLFLLRRQLSGLRYDGAHLKERFGLLVLIALGESLFDIGAPFTDQTRLSVLQLTAVAVSFVLVCALWWTYFDSSNEAIASALDAADVHIQVARHVTFSHFGVTAAIVMVAVGFENMVGTPGAELTFTHLNLLYLGTVLFVGSLVYMRYAMSRVLRVARLSAALLILALVPVALHLPGIVATLLLAVVLVAVVELEKKWPAQMSRGRAVTVR